MVKKIQLKNGLKVLLVENRKSPVISIQMWVHTGSADEPKGLEGVSHFIEHLVFKGTRSFKVGEIAALVEGSGGELNAYTSFDETVFYVTISKHFDHVGLKVISEMMGHPLFDPTEIDNEREVVIEEIKRGNDSLYRQSSRLLFSSLYTKHPYGLPVIGYEENIRNVTPDQIKAYFRDRYAPGNMTLVIAGDFDSSDMNKKVRKFFSDFRPSKVKKIRRPVESKSQRIKIDVAQAPFEETLVHWAWPIPNVRHKDIPALDVLSMVLGQGEASWLNRDLRINEHLVNFVSASTFTPKDPGFFSISASLQVNQLKRTGEVIEETLKKALHDLANEEELKRAKINIQSEEFYSLETVDGMARKYGNYQHLFGDYRAMNEFLKQIEKLQPKDLQRVAQKYLTPQSLRICLMTPADPAPLKKVLSSWATSYKKSYLPPKVRTLKKRVGKKGKPIEIRSLTNGVRIIFKPSFETQVISLRSALLGGVRVENANNNGVCEMVANTWLGGTASLPESQIHNKVESMASSLSPFSGRNTLGLSMTTLAPHGREMRELFVDNLLHPLFPERVIDRERNLVLEQIRTRQDNPAQVCILNFMKAFFSDHPYAKDPHGTEETLGRLTSSDLKDLHNRLLCTKNFSMALTGHVDVEEWMDFFERSLATIPHGPKFEDRFSFTLKDQPERVYSLSQKEQSHIVIGFPGLTFTSPERYTLQLIQSILAGQGGRLFLELRDKASLAYSVAPMKMEGIDAGYFGAYIACSPEKASKALSMLNQEFQRLTQDLVPKSEMDRSIRYLIGRHDIDLQKNSSVSAAMLFDDIYGLPADETFHFAKKLKSISSQDIRDLSQKIFAANETISVVGPRCPW